ncbi:MAG: DUF4886 domain-containing protein [Clostridia bacterium]|nr:DUF4886 domain-containing protein [Clostridia bacterium]
MKTKLLITVLFTALLICFFAFSVSATCTGEHSYEYQVELGADGFFGEITLNIICTEEKCYSKTTEKISPIFICLGYSYNESNCTQGYIVNRESLARYEEVSGDSLSFGAVTTTVSVIGDGNPLDKNGNPVSEKVMKCDFTSTNYTFIDVCVKGIPENLRNEKFICSLYVKSQDGVKYLDNAVEKTIRGARSYKDVEAGVQKEEPEESERIVINGVGYRQLEMSFAKSAFWSSGSLSASGTDLNKKFWASAVPLSPKDLPVGSIIVLDCENYWQYRIDKDATRGTNTKQSVLVIDENWWGEAKTACFTLSMHKTENTSSSPSVDLSGYTDVDLKNALKFYAPITETVSEEKTYTKQNWNDDGALKVLLIGNSFSQDTCYLSFQAAKAMGLEDVKIANLYIGAGSISDHIYRHKQGATATLQQNTSKGGWSSTNATLETAVKSDNWDFILLQQVSPLSGEAYSFESVNALIDIIEPMCPSARLGWNMTWAYQSTFNDGRFDSYDRDQTKMYQAIVSATQSKIVTNDRIEIVVPIGTVIQNVRSSYIGDTLTRDGYHLNESLGRQVASLALVHILTGVSIDGVNTTNYNKITDESALVVSIEAIKNAVKTPFEVTESQYKDEQEVVPPENPDINEGGDNTGGDNTGEGTGGGEGTGNEGTDTPSTEITGYTQLTVSEMELTRNQYYNSSNGTIATGTNVCFPGYYTVKKFTKETLPVGSKIFLGAGWQYRLIVKDEAGKYSNSYVKTTEDKYVEITEEWWSGRAEVCFTVSAKDHAYGKVPTTDLTAEEVGTSKFIIYIPVFSD